MTDSKEAEALFALAKERYGDCLSDEQLEEVKKSIGTNLETVNKLWDVELENVDEPYNVFKPYRRKE